MRKGFVDQVAGSGDQRQRLIRITPAGLTLWNKLPDPVAEIRAIAFGDSDPAEMATAIRVLQTATQRLTDHLAQNAKG